ncbi:hypothetical protein [Bifidobacterium sp. SO1]|uniref:hypothetical protein n=1 Tax=Bifidobacterium sp. SO1 TaxID=2809029 RepID=UPI001BDCA70D|nr:hypothetical protein [Bifidobacterium sp. SO1]MBT1161210.1 hypothetical protein [Bifidobacterium sp. SO1]
MGRVTVNKHVGRDIARLFGPQLTAKVAAKGAPLLATNIRAATVDDRNHAVARADLTGNVSIETFKRAYNHQIVLSVTGREGKEIASLLEFGYFNERANRHMKGLHAARKTASELRM